MTAVPDPQEALQEQIAQAIFNTLLDQGTPNLRAEAVLVAADAVLPVVQAHEQALADENERLRRDLDIAECVAGARQINYQDQYDRVLEWALRDQRRAGKAEDALASLRDAVSRLADDLERHSQRAGRKAKGTWDQQTIGLFIGDQRAYLYAARRLRSLLGDKENGR